MKTTVSHSCSLFLLVLLAIPCISFANLPPDSLWSRTYGGGGADQCNSMQRTGDGGYVLAGSTSSYGAGGDDFYLVKTDANAVTQWSRTFGGDSGDVATEIHQTSDGGYVMAGYTMSFGGGNADYWLVKTNANGDSLWSRTYGGANNDYCASVQQTLDGGYVMAGWSNSFSGGSYDIYVVKTDGNGIQQWSQAYGGASDDWCESVVQTTDGGYILAGATWSYGAGIWDMWLVKTNAVGDTLWTRTFGGLYDDAVRAVLQTPDGGYVLAGYASSIATQHDMSLVKTDSVGNQLWSRTYGGTNEEFCYAVKPTWDGGYILGGATASFGSGNKDFYLVKTDGDGIQQWTKTFGGSSEDWCTSVEQIYDGDFVLAGYTSSFGAGDRDVWLVKISAEIPPAIQVTPPDSVWSRAYGGGASDWFGGICRTSDGGYMLSGQTSSFSVGGADGWLVKLNANGDSLWSRFYGGGNDDGFASVVQTSDGGYVAAGTTQSYGAGSTDMYLVKTAANGNQQWRRTFGGTNQDWCEPMIQTSDGGFLLAGATWSYGAGIWDFWLVKTNANGDSLWSHTYGDYADDHARALIQTADGGYLLGGCTISFGAHNQYDMLAVKTDAVGNQQWSRRYGGGGWNEECYGMLQTPDSGFVLVGKTDSYGAGGIDFFMVKTDVNGVQQWYRTFGGSGEDICYRVWQTLDGGFLLGGYTTSFGSGAHDYYVVKTDGHGQLEWSRTLGGVGSDDCGYVAQNPDGSYLFGGSSSSFGSGGSDIWLVRMGADLTSFTVQWTNPSGGLWQNPFNWNPQRVPGELDTAMITAPGSYVVTINQNASVGRLTLGNGADTSHQTLLVNCPSCSLSVYGNSLVLPNGILAGASGGRIANSGSNITLTDSGQIALVNTASLSLGTGNTLQIAAGTLALSDGANISGGVVVNAGTVTHSNTGTSTVSASYRDQGNPVRQSVLVSGGKLVINPPDSANVHSWVDVSGGAELQLARATLDDSSLVSGSGRLTLAAGNERFAGDFELTGTLRSTGGTVTFQPRNVGVSLDSFQIEAGVSFTSSVPVNANAVAMHGGTTTGDLTATTLWDWTAGTFIGSSGSTFSISPGCSLSVHGAGAKSLDTRDLFIGGTASMSGPGTLSLVNGASMTVTAGGTLTIGDSLTIAGNADSLINHGQMYVQCPNDSSFINAFLWNSTAGRTPGTIDILSGRVVCARTRNEGTVIVHDQAEARLLGNCVNSGLIDMREGTTWFEHDSLINQPSGILYLAGNSSIEGGGVVQNGGYMYRLGGSSRTPSSSAILTAFHNLATTGYLHVTADTLAVLNAASDNAGDITIDTGAVLRVPSSFTNLPGGTIHGGGALNVSINNLVIQYDNNGNILLSWTPIPGATHYDVYAATQPYDNLVQYSIIATVYDPFFFHYQGASVAKRFYRVVPR